MPGLQEKLFHDLSDAVVNMDEEKAVAVSNEIIAHKFDAYEAIVKGLSDGMNRAGKLFEDEEYFVPELLICSDAMYAGLNLLKPHLPVNNVGPKEKVVIGVIEGDTHDIGKNLVKIMLETAGYEVIDLGRNIPAQNFVQKAVEVEARFICISTLMTTTMDGIKDVIDLLHKEGVRDRFKVLVGGGPISQAFADRIGADGYANNAAEAVKVANKLIGGAN